MSHRVEAVVLGAHAAARHRDLLLVYMAVAAAGVVIGLVLLILAADLEVAAHAMTTRPLSPRVSRGYRDWLLPVAVAVYVVGAFAFLAPLVVEPNGPSLPTLANGALTQAQAYTLDSVKQLNSFLISMTTLMFGWAGWYLSQIGGRRSRPSRAQFSLPSWVFSGWRSGTRRRRTPRPRPSWRRMCSASRPERAGSCFTCSSNSGVCAMRPS